jgi:hypothetical protein
VDNYAAVVATLALVIAALALVWNIVSWVLERRHRGRPDVTATILKFPDGTVSWLMLVNGPGAGQARYLHYLGVADGKRVQGLAGLGFLAPGETVHFNLPLDVEELRTPIVWVCLDTSGNVHARSNDGEIRRYSKRSVSEGRAPAELEAIFKALYPDVSLPLSFPNGAKPQPISFRE